MKKKATEIDLVPLYDIADEIIQNYKQEIINIDAIATGDLLNSIDFEIVQKDENTLTLQLIVLDYYYFIEFGRGKTGKLETKWNDPIGDISRWITKKIQRGKWIGRADRPIPTTSTQIRQAAYAIVQKIHEQGYYGLSQEGKHPLEKSLQKSMGDGLIEKFCNVFKEQYQDDILVDITGLSDKLKKRPK